MKTKAIFLPFLLLVSLNQVRGDLLRPLLENSVISSFVTTLLKQVVNLFPPSINTTPKSEIRDEYDFIVVGSGPAGSVVASRLSEITGWNVLLLEAGKSESWITSVPYIAPLMQWTPYNWDYKMEYQENVCRAMENGRCKWPRGKALGGGSVINYMIYTRGNEEDFNKWERNGNTGWNYKTILEYYKKIEKSQLDSDIIDEQYHGKDGYLHTEHVFKSELTDAIIEAGNGDKIPRDYNGINQTVFARIQGTLNKGRRDSAAKSYLVPALDRKNLHILTEAHVTRIILDDDNIARSVEYLYNGDTYVVNATREVILSAGTFNSPQLLMLSGIGPKDQLEKFNIPVKLNQPWVGMNMADHIAYLGTTLTFNKKYEDFFSFLNPLVQIRWLLTGKGPLTSLGGATALGFTKTEVADYLEDIPDIEFIMGTFGGPQSDYGYISRKIVGVTDDFYNTVLSEPDHGSALILPLLLLPKSKGYLELQSADPLVPVKLYGNYWSDPHDKKTLIAGIRRIIKLADTEPLKSMGARLSTKRIPDCMQYGNLTDEYFSCALEYLASTLHHQTGTCKMGPISDQQAVVGPDLKVHNVGNLRVIDSSIIPEPISAHTNAPSFVIGEKGADLIKKDHPITT